MNTILFYGNCQLYAIKNTLNLQNYIQYHVECFSTDINEQDFLDIIKKSNIIVTQIINNNYRDKHYLSTNYILDNCNKDIIIIIVDSCYFEFYYFDLIYKSINNKLLREPIDYHYNKLIECYKNNISKNYYIVNYINNENLVDKEYLNNLAEKSLNELLSRYNKNMEIYKRDNIFIISTHEYIKNNYKDKLLFYSMNHPTKYVIQFICEEIIKILNVSNTINYNIEFLNNTKCILYKSIQQVVNFDISEHKPLVLNKISINDIVSLYYDTYRNKNVEF